MDADNCFHAGFFVGRSRLFFNALQRGRPRSAARMPDPAVFERKKKQERRRQLLFLTGTGTGTRTGTGTGTCAGTCTGTARFATFVLAKVAFARFATFILAKVAFARFATFCRKIRRRSLKEGSSAFPDRYKIDLPGGTKRKDPMREGRTVGSALAAGAGGAAWGFSTAQAPPAGHTGKRRLPGR